MQQMGVTGLRLMAAYKCGLGWDPNHFRTDEGGGSPGVPSAGPLGIAGRRSARWRSLEDGHALRHQLLYK